MEGAESVKNFTAEDVTAKNVELLEGKRGVDNAWYPCSIKLTGKNTVLIMHFQGFQGSEQVPLSKFSTLQDVFRRVRLISPNLDASHCGHVKGRLVCGLNHVSEDQQKWFDASVVKIKEGLHINKNTEAEKCTCTFTITWHEGPDKLKRAELPASSIRVPLDTTNAEDNSQLKLLLNAVSTRIQIMASNRMGNKQTKHVKADDDNGQGASPGLHIVNDDTKAPALRKLRSSAARVAKGLERAKPTKAWTLAAGREELHGVSVESRLYGKALSFDTHLRLKSDPDVRDVQQLALVPAYSPAGLAADVQGASGGVVPKLPAQRRSRLKKSEKSTKSKELKKPEERVPIEDTPTERDLLCSGSWPVDSVLRIENVEKGLAPHEARMFLQSMFDNVGTVILSPPVEESVPAAEESVSAAEESVPAVFGFVVFRDSTSAAAACKLLTADTCLVASCRLRPWFVSRVEETDEEKRLIAHIARAQFNVTSSLSQERAATSPLRWFTAVKEREYELVLNLLRVYKEFKEERRALSRGFLQQEAERIRTFEAEQTKRKAA